MRRFALFMMEDNRQPAIEGEAQPVPPDNGSENHSAGHIRNTDQATDSLEDDDVPA